MVRKAVAPTRMTDMIHCSVCGRPITVDVGWVCYEDWYYCWDCAPEESKPADTPKHNM